MSKVYWPLYEVFVRSKQGLSHRHVGSLHAAMIKWRWRMPAMPTPPQRRLLIWVVKASEIVASQPEDRGEFFDRRKAKSTVIRLSIPCRTAWNICEAAMNNPNPVATYALRLGDNGLVLASVLGAWCGHAPELEIDLALANIGLDLLGQARNFLSYAAELNGCGDEDTLAFGRDERQFSNLLLVEQPNGNFADTIARQFFIDVWHVALFSRLVNSRDAQLAAIALKG
ncbi:phenylacetate-CoA oxygenase, PaaI subunit [Klebsiella pneumoniae]|uniref:Phenylacetate-CoA oxygenase, PaaI subunit n=1 Tax=Klebsiella pneumoniae TaxID=573 RepID=A0A2X3CNT1_KLEPN|nr:phenylacetate-CoA oxygenase, PaaI subunit [Klebsiella pneumoniae]